MGSEFCAYDSRDVSATTHSAYYLTTPPYGASGGERKEYEEGGKGIGVVITHLQVLVGSLLPLAVHGARRLAAELADDDEHDEASTNSNGSVQGDFPALSWGILSTGSVCTEGDVVSCSAGQYIRPHACRSPMPFCFNPSNCIPSRQMRARKENYFLRTGLLLLVRQLRPVDLHAVAQRHPQVGLLLRGHGLPPLLDIGERRVGDGVGGSGLHRSQQRAAGPHCCPGRATQDRRAQHRGRDGTRGGEGWVSRSTRRGREGASEVSIEVN